MLKVVHYLNQFFAGMGGEDQADLRPMARDGLVGPGMAIQKLFGDQAEIIGTIVCGDNYFAENIESAVDQVTTLMRPFQPDLIIAGPAFNAGRYGIACGAVCKGAADKLGVPAVTAMFEENPGLDLYRHDVYILPTEDSVKGMIPAVQAMVRFGLKLTSGETIGRPSNEGYFPRGILVNEFSELNGAERSVNMLLQKLKGETYASEVPRPNYQTVQPAPRIKDLTSARIALVTDGGLVPLGNPDQIEIRTATRYGKYSLNGITRLEGENYEVKHGGYDSVLVRQDPNRLVPVDAMRELEKEGRIGTLHDFFYSTTGVANIVETMEKMGAAMAKELVAEGVSGVILTST